MISYNSRVYSINDFVEWDKQEQLVLNPSFQRRAVWSGNAKSYLMDTILRGKPIPKVFIRQKVNITTKKTTREVVDGQQRLRTVLSFIKDGFSVSLRQNSEHGGRLFSQLSEDTQEHILTYEISVDLLINMPDGEILDIFGRLNSYAITLNEQEKINANHFGAFKILADAIGRKYTEYWKDQRILTPQQILRMQEVALVADLLIAMHEGIKSKKQIKRLYGIYEKSFEDDTITTLKSRFDNVIEKMGKLYPEGLSNTEFRRVHLFYSLFTSVAHCLYGLPDFDAPNVSLDNVTKIETARNGLDRVKEIFELEMGMLNEREQRFMQDSRRATTDETVRERRTAFLVKLMG